MTVVQQNPTQHDGNYNPQSSEPSEPLPISTSPMNVSAFNSWETPHTTTEDNTFYSEEELRRLYWTYPLNETLHSEGEPRRINLLSRPSPPSPPRKMKRKLEMGKSFPKRRGVSQHACETCRQAIPPTEDIPGPSTKD